jgi:hypothetical protein
VRLRACVSWLTPVASRCGSHRNIRESRAAFWNRGLRPHQQLRDRRARVARRLTRDGSMDWLYLPRFDSAACFVALWGTADNGRWRIAPASLPLASCVDIRKTPSSSRPHTRRRKAPRPSSISCRYPSVRVRPRASFAAIASPVSPRNKHAALLHGGAWGRNSPFGFVIMRGE